MDDAVSVQREYYRATAARYDSMHGEAEHVFPMALMTSMIDFLDVETVLDIGSGTGYTLIALKQSRPRLTVIGIEPSADLRAEGYRKGLSTRELIDGDAQSLLFPDGSFDLVCEFAALHHIPNPTKAVSEMLRVARKGIFISDSNNFGQGSVLARGLKQLLNALKLWPLANFLKTRGKGYIITDGDGLSYSYSVFNQYRLISQGCKTVHIINTAPAGINLYRSSASVALLGIKAGPHSIT